VAVDIFLHLNTGGDKVRPMNITIENITCENIISYTDVLKIGTYGPFMHLKHFLYKNVS
jgi:hypothetical protein